MRLCQGKTDAMRGGSTAPAMAAEGTASTPTLRGASRRKATRRGGCSRTTRCTVHARARGGCGAVHRVARTRLGFHCRAIHRVIRARLSFRRRAIHRVIRARLSFRRRAVSHVIRARLGFCYGTSGGMVHLRAGTSCRSGNGVLRTRMDVRRRAMSSVVHMRLCMAVGNRLRTMVVNGRMHTTGRAVMRVVVCRMVVRMVRVVNVRRVVPVTSVPGSRAPGRHDAGRRQRRKGEDSHAVSIIAIHRAAVAVTVNREAVHIIAGIGPNRIAAIGTDGHTG